MARAAKKVSRKKAVRKRGTGTGATATKAPAIAKKGINLQEAGKWLESATAEERVEWTLKYFPGKTVLSSSFGAQSAVSLHMVTQLAPDIPVLLIDTGYLFPETYQFIDQLTERLQLNLKVYRPEMTAAWQEARYGKLWEQGLEGIERYNAINKTEPMDRAVKDLGAKAWIAGVRRDQGSTRNDMDVLVLKNGTLKIHPIIDWNDKTIYDYLKKHDLPYHPLWNEGYTSIGDWNTSHRLTDVKDADSVRFFGLKRECGLHENTESVKELTDYAI